MAIKILHTNKLNDTDEKISSVYIQQQGWLQDQVKKKNEWEERKNREYNNNIFWRMNVCNTKMIWSMQRYY